ncbi:hypothetical protein GCM10010255_01410 [Streptomyces coeruleofuscus]|uniref:Alpha/beta hydrolase n=1 Tax=Streptomyces coeruleofuscus TaxID=66879 RepID=A0ABN3HGY2_9ACTN
MLNASFAHADTRTDLAASVWHQLFASGQHTLLAEYLNLMGLGEAVLNALTPDQAHVRAEQLATTLPSGTGDQLGLVRRVDVRADLAGISVPTLVVITTADPLISPALQRH